MTQPTTARSDIDPTLKTLLEAFPLTFTAADGMLTGGAVVRVEVAQREAAAMEKQNRGRCRATVGIGWRPTDPDADGARRTRNGPVLDPQLGMQLPARQVAQPLPRRVDTIVS